MKPPLTLADFVSSLHGCGLVLATRMKGRKACFWHCRQCGATVKAKLKQPPCEILKLIGGKARGKVAP